MLSAGTVSTIGAFGPYRLPALVSARQNHPTLLDDVSNRASHSTLSSNLRFPQVNTEQTCASLTGVAECYGIDIVLNKLSKLSQRLCTGPAISSLRSIPGHLRVHHKRGMKRLESFGAALQIDSCCFCLAIIWSG